jgi:hypothetical protein
MKATSNLFCTPDSSSISTLSVNSRSSSSSSLGTNSGKSLNTTTNSVKSLNTTTNNNSNNNLRKKKPVVSIPINLLNTYFSVSNKGPNNNTNDTASLYK